MKSVDVMCAQSCGERFTFVTADSVRSYRRQGGVARLGHFSNSITSNRLPGLAQPTRRISACSVRRTICCTLGIALGYCTLRRRSRSGRGWIGNQQTTRGDQALLSLGSHGKLLSGPQLGQASIDVHHEYCQKVRDSRPFALVSEREALAAATRATSIVDKRARCLIPRR